MDLGPLHLLWFFLLVSILPIYIMILNWRRQLTRQREAAVRGWRYQVNGWQDYIRPKYLFTGTTAKGVVWELKRLWQSGELVYRWLTLDVPAPYGMLVIMPRETAAIHKFDDMPVLIRPIRYESDVWQDAYVIFTSHKRLAQKLLSQAVEADLHQWPRWPAPGALDRIVWDQNSLQIFGRYQNDWALLERIVALGVKIAEIRD
jgi:hypothetical protein